MSLCAPRGRISFFGGLPIVDRHISIVAFVIHYREIALTGASSPGPAEPRALELIARGLGSRAGTHYRFALDRAAEAFAVVEARRAIKAVVLP